MKVIIRLLDYLLSAINTHTPASSPRPVHWAKPILDSRFYQVDNRLFRGEQPQYQEITQLQSLAIDVVINLRFFSRDEDALLFQSDNELAHVHLINRPTLTWHVSPKWIAEILSLIETQRQQGSNVLVHCYHGGDRTGIVMAMYRIIYQGWTIDEAKREMQQGGYDFHAVWVNLSRLLSEKKVAQVKRHLNKA